MPRKRQTWPQIRPRTNKAGLITSYIVDGGYHRVNGRGRLRVRHSYKTLALAQGKAAEMRITRRNEGTIAVSMPSSERNDAERALELLRPHKVTLTQAAEFYLDNIEIIRSSKTVSEVLDELLKLKEQDGRSSRYLRDLRFRLGAFAKSEIFSTLAIHEIDERMIDDWLRSLDG
jgi:hypothetical protein